MIEEASSQFLNSMNSIFKIISINENTLVLTDLYDDRDYIVTGLDCHQAAEGVLLDGSIGKRGGDIYWQWYFTGGVYPTNAIRYITFV